MEHNQPEGNTQEGRNRTVISETGIDFKCPDCAGSLKYDIDKQLMLCEMCGSEFPVRRLQDPSEAKVSRHPGEMETVEYHCPSCGASLHTTSTGVTSFCSFCGSDVVLEERMTRMRRPDRIVPFTLSRKGCEKLYRERLKGALLVPDEMRNQETVTHFRPVYIPFWCLSGEGDGVCQGELTKTSSDADYIITNTYSAELKQKVSVSSIYYDACSQFDDETAQWLAFDGKKSVLFHPAYLSGFYAEAPDVESGMLSGLTRDYAVDSLSRACSSSLRSGAASKLPENFTERAELVLMPVWLLASRQGDKMIYTAIKGTKDDEKIRCDLPVSLKRFSLLLCILAAVLTGLILYLHHYILLRPQITAALSCLLSVLCWNTAGPFLAGVRIAAEDLDPTRRMLKGVGKGISRDIFNYIPSSDRNTKAGTRYTIRPKHLLIITGIICAALVLYVITNRNPLRAVNSLISDHSLLPPVLCIISAGLLYYIKSDNEGLPLLGFAVLYIQIAISVCQAFCGGIKTALYILTLTSFILTLLVLLAAFRQHNTYVTRPVPFFSDEEGSK